MCQSQSSHLPTPAPLVSMFVLFICVCFPWLLLISIANEATDKGLLSKIYKQLLQFNSRKINDPVKKWPAPLAFPLILWAAHIPPVHSSSAPVNEEIFIGCKQEFWLICQSLLCGHVVQQLSMAGLTGSFPSLRLTFQSCELLCFILNQKELFELQGQVHGTLEDKCHRAPRKLGGGRMFIWHLLSREVRSL